LSFEAASSGERGEPAGAARFSPVAAMLAPLVLYLTLALLLLGCNVSWTQYYFGYSTDSLQFAWFLNWWPFAITHGINPFICRYVSFPAGYNFTWATSVPVLSILLWPVTVLASPVLSYNILALAGPALSAWTGFLLAREVTRSWAASAVGGFLFGFSMLELTAAGELNLESLCLIPLAFLLGIWRLRGRLQRRSFIILLSLLLTAQLGISTEFLASLCIMGALAWLIFLLFAPASERSFYWRLALDIALAAPLTLVLASPFLYYLLRGLPDVPARINGSSFQSTEILRFFLPAAPVHSGGEALAGIARLLGGFAPDYWTFISPPVLLILALYFCRNIRKPYRGALLASICVAVTLALGVVVEFNGKSTGIPLPWAVFSHIPVVRSIVPARLLNYVILGASIAVALWLAEPAPRALRLLRFALAGLACLYSVPAKVLLVPTPWEKQRIMEMQTEFRWSRWPEQPFFSAEHVRAALGPMSKRAPNVLILPDPLISPGMAWQLNAGLSFTQATGYTGFRLNHEQKWSGMDGLIYGLLPPDFPAFFPAFCAAHRVDYILIGPGVPPGVVSAIEALGWPRRMDQGIEIITPPKP
jgi:hypothetical protein